MVGGEHVLSQFRPEGVLSVNFEKQRLRVLAEIQQCISSGDIDIAKELIVNSPLIFDSLVPGKGAEIQAELTAYLNSLVQSKPVEQPQVISPVEPAVSAERQVIPVETIPPLKQVSEAEASQKIAVCSTIEQVGELIKGWEIPVSLNKLDDGTEVAREPVLGYLAVARMKILFDLIIKATDDRLDEVIKNRQKLVPRFGGLREKVIALARAERTKTGELSLSPAQDEVKETEPTLVQKTREFCRYLSINFGKVYSGDLIERFVRLLTDVSEGLVPVDATSAAVELDLNEDTIGTNFTTIQLHMLKNAVQSFLTESDFSTAKQLQACSVSFQIGHGTMTVGSERDSYIKSRNTFGTAKVVISPK